MSRNDFTFPDNYDMTMDQCRNFLSSLIIVAGKLSTEAVSNVIELIQKLIDGILEPEGFLKLLEQKLKSKHYPCLIHNLKKHLPYIQRALTNGEMTIERIRPPRPEQNSVPTIQENFPKYLTSGEGTVERISTPSLNVAEWNPVSSNKENFQESLISRERTIERISTPCRNMAEWNPVLSNKENFQESLITGERTIERISTPCRNMAEWNPVSSNKENFQESLISRERTIARISTPCRNMAEWNPVSSNKTRTPRPIFDTTTYRTLSSNEANSMSSEEPTRKGSFIRSYDRSTSSMLATTIDEFKSSTGGSNESSEELKRLWCSEEPPRKEKSTKGNEVLSAFSSLTNLERRQHSLSYDQRLEDVIKERSTKGEEVPSARSSLTNSGSRQPKSSYDQILEDVNKEKSTKGEEAPSARSSLTNSGSTQPKPPSEMLLDVIMSSLKEKNSQRQ